MKPQCSSVKQNKNGVICSFAQNKNKLNKNPLLVVIP